LSRKYCVSPSTPRVAPGFEVAGIEQPEKSHQGLSVSDFSSSNHLFQLDPREATKFKDFVRLRCRVRFRQAARFNQAHAFGQETGTGIKIEKTPERPGPVAGLLLELAARGFFDGFSRLDPARHEFPEPASRGISVLAHEEQSAVVEVRQDHHGTAMDHHLAVCRDAARLFDAIDFELDYLASVNSLSAEDAETPMHARNSSGMAVVE